MFANGRQLADSVAGEVYIAQSATPCGTAMTVKEFIYNRQKSYSIVTSSRVLYRAKTNGSLSERVKKLFSRVLSLVHSSIRKTQKSIWALLRDFTRHVIRPSSSERPCPDVHTAAYTERNKKPVTKPFFSPWTIPQSSLHNQQYRSLWTRCKQTCYRILQSAFASTLETI